MVKHPIRACIIVPGVALLTSCTSLYVRSDVNHALIGTVHCRTFAWAGAFHGNSPLRNTIANPLNENRLRSAIAAHLGSGGIQPKAADADCLVGYGIGSNTVAEDTYPYGWGWGCSHSLDLRMAANASRLAPVCLSDCYPSKAILLNHDEQTIFADPSGNCAGYIRGRRF